ncbi:MarR family winged helix-turn-helix transcriptional regulator [Planomonospora parontospora]|uniref:MarR family winged helix-turn-helix transcriptional regulator n=1 Tax=Planomonospora parontospora TaxID=58119 RepID=UPI001670756C|nr:MarR family transcriptional regulator [Planomonospora parontospora]GGL15397.1 transcriptional regulator [Planomonospora parontospora subsp. antibiotica]GII15955.1 transcriptional regulator [Planomonospora parontospora subsp. antibiotica]
MNDAVDRILDQWAAVRPGLDTSAMGVVGRISRASRLLERGVRAYFDEHGLEPWEFDVLATLFRADRTLCMGDLAGAAMVSSGALTNRIDRLVAKGLVTRATAEGNRRLVLVTLTETGHRLVGGLVDGHVANEDRLLDGLTPAERDELAALLRKLLGSLGDTGP